MARDDSGPQQSEADQRRDELLRRALATPPISNEEIIRRSRQHVQRLRRSPNKGGASK